LPHQQDNPTEHAVPPSLNGWNADYVDEMHQQWLRDPNTVPESWRFFFDGFTLAAEHQGTTVDGQSAVDQLLSNFRRWGHLAARIDPLGRRPLDTTLCSLEAVGLNEHDLNREFTAGPWSGTLSDIMSSMQSAWCGTMGIESEHIRCPKRRDWWRSQIESDSHPLTADTRRSILHGLQRATGLERFLMRRYIGSKWFSLEGGETLIPMLLELLEAAAEDGVEEIALGMAHRGRVNVLVSVLEKSYDQLFTEFEEAWTEDFVESGGDVKYHRGYSSTVTTQNGHALHLTMASNPSHLEWGHPVVVGRVRAKQRLRGDTTRKRCVPVLVHGDAALPGQGIAWELANMAGLPSYDVGGSIHLVINNQIGFTAEHKDAFASVYCTDILRGLDVPILHVNGADPDQCVRAMMLAWAYRHEFGADVAIDIWGWRKYGHNETDEPRFTNPALYAAVDAQPSIVETYAKTLADDGVIKTEEADQAEQRLLDIMNESQQRIRSSPVRPTPPAFDDHSTWAGFNKMWSDEPVDTTVSKSSLNQIAEALGTLPDGFTPHPKTQRLLDQRRVVIAEDKPLDWAMGELLAYGSLLLDGCPIRLTGEDCLRGTFSHRHAVVADALTGEPWSPLDHIDIAQSRLCVHNSPVTESGCIGFEYGYSLGDPNMLVIWEAQFGDFVNVGQVYLDQFIASAEQKWRRHSGLVCLLPHGYEGMGPEHSSARLERLLQLCANDNMEVVVPTNPAQIFHLLRRQIRRSFRKPLIVLTPKSLLRHKDAVSHVADLTSGQFETILDDPTTNPADVTRVLLCSGKVGWDLIAARIDTAAEHTTAVIRIEQLHPFPAASILNLMDRYAHVDQWVWAQEEPRNAGAWTWVSDRFREQFDRTLAVVSRPANASPAVGSARLHREEQRLVLEAALDIGPTSSERIRKEQQA
jgi:2-oxoglutarate dehydrogenase E1 component